MVTTSKDKVQCFKKKVRTKSGKMVSFVTCKDNVTGRQLRKKNGVKATPGTIRVKKNARSVAVAKQKARAKGPVAARTRSKGPANQVMLAKRKKKAPARPVIKMTSVGAKKRKPKLKVVTAITKAQGQRLKNQGYILV